MTQSEGPLPDKTEKALQGIGIGVLIAVAACGACAAVVIVLALFGLSIGSVGPTFAPSI